MASLENASIYNATWCWIEANRVESELIAERLVTSILDSHRPMTCNLSKYTQTLYHMRRGWEDYKFMALHIDLLKIRLV